MCKFCWNKQFFILLFLALAAHAQEQKRLAILRTVDDGDPSVELTDLNHLTVKLREIAGNVLQNRYGIMTEQSIIDKLGKDNAVKACKEAEGCLAKLGRKINADYIGQARLGRFGGNLTISVELYNSATGLQVSTTISGEAKDVYGLLAVLNTKAPGMFEKMPGVSSGKAPPIVAGGISGLEKASDYELDDEKRYLVNLSTEPSGAILSFDGVPAASCPKTPCKLELREGSVRIIAALEQYETANTVVSIKQNNQNIAITLKPNFGTLEIKPAYLDGISKNEQWSITINGYTASSWTNWLPPGKHKVKLGHSCYEDLNFEVGINKGKNEVFDMAGNITLKKGGLVLSAERDGEPISEPVFVNDKRVGETPFSGAVPLCAKVEIGDDREAVDVKLKHNEKVKHTVKSSRYFTDSRDGKRYKLVKIGTQTWMVENLNFNASGSKCYGNQESNCQKYGWLYNWNTAKTACPKSWHLPSDAEWNVLMSSVGGEKTAGKFLKATSGWNNKGNGEDKYGFSALPGGYGYSDGSFTNVGNYGLWWSATERNANYAYYRYMDYDSESVNRDNYNKSNYLFSVRCVKD